MRCQSCGHDNRATALFCENCGTKLAPVCPACRTEVRPAARFCDACGQRIIQTAQPALPAEPRAYTPPYLQQKILRDRSALQGERRTVTVLFADAVGSTSLAERLDEEVVHRIMEGCLSRMLDAVHRYEGTVNQFLGDGIMALFGAPIAHEDSARRAVAAALDMQHALDTYAHEVQQRFRLAYRFRVGLNTGPVVVGAIGDNLRMDYTAVGDTTNLAARMQQMAEPGTVYLSEHTYRAVHDYFVCQTLGPVTVKNRAEPVVAYKAIRAKGITTRIEAATQRGLTPFVGRNHELQVLKGYFTRAQRSQGQIVFISGEAGIGKSRLLLEFRHSLANQELTWLEGHSISFGKNIAYLPIIDILKRAFGIQEGDSDADIVRRVDDGTSGWNSAARAMVPYLKYLLSVDPGDPTVVTMEPLERRAGIFDGLRTLMIEASRLHPLVLVVEDLHWMDEMSQEALAAVVDTIATAPILLIATYRHGYAPSLGEQTSYSRVALDHLPPQHSATLAKATLKVNRLPEQLQHLITSKAEGNPFFVEEVAKSLVESGVVTRSNGTYILDRPVEQIRVPSTLQEIILSRIDRLAPPSRQVLQLASVLGREFTLRLLQRISDAEVNLETVLVELKALDFIYQKSYLPEPIFVFKHALTQEVAQSTLLLERRKALHGTVAAAIEELYGDRLAEQYEMLAEHYSQGEEWEKALGYAVKAGDRAAAAYANQNALDFYARALTACERLGDSALATSIAVAQTRGVVNLGIGNFQGAIDDFNRMLAAASRLDDRHLEGLALGFRGMAEFFFRTFNTAEQTLRSALVIAEDGFDDVRLAASAWLSIVLLTINRPAEAKPLMQVIEELTPKVDDPFSQAWGGLIAAMAPNWIGRFDEALAVLDRWRTAANKSVSMLLVYRWVEALARAGKGEYQQALALLNDILSASNHIGHATMRAHTLNTLGWVYGELQDHQRAIAWNTEGVTAAQTMNNPECESNARLNLGDSLMALGRLDEAEEHFQHTYREHRRGTCPPQDRWALWLYRQHLFHSYGELWLTRGKCDQALACAGECLQLAESTGRQKNIVKARRLRGQVFLAEGKLEEAEQEIATALEIAREVGNPPQLWKTLVALGELRQAQGKSADALQAYHAALVVIDNVAAGLTDTSLRETFLASPHVQHIRLRLSEGSHQPASSADEQHTCE